MYPFTLLDKLYNTSQDQRFLIITKFSKGNKHRISLRVESKGALRSKIHEQLKTENSSVPYFLVYISYLISYYAHAVIYNIYNCMKRDSSSGIPGKISLLYNTARLQV